MALETCTGLNNKADRTNSQQFEPEQIQIVPKNK